MNRVTSRSKGLLIIAGLIGFGLIGTAAIHFGGIDVAWTRAFYLAGGPHDGWIYGGDVPWRTIYEYGEYPGVLLAAACLALAVASRYGKARKCYFKPALVVVLTVVIGPGLVVNGILKPYWGRPRPQEITVFGGTKEFRPAQRPAGPGGGKSFPCGHCSIAFSIVSGASFSACHPAVAGAALGAGLVYGIAAGEARMAQGGHFPSDVLWSGIIVLVIAALLHWVVFRIPDEFEE